MLKTKRVLLMLVILCCLSDIAFSGSAVLKKKNPEKAKAISVFPGLIFSGASDFYLGDVANGIGNTMLDFFFYRYIYYLYLWTDKNEVVIPLAAVYSILRVKQKKAKRKTENWNKSVENHNVNAYIVMDKALSKISLVLGIAVTATSFLDTSAYSDPPFFMHPEDPLIFGIGLLVSSFAYSRQAKRLENAVFEDDEASIPSIAFHPMIRNEYYGIAASRRF